MNHKRSARLLGVWALFFGAVVLALLSINRSAQSGQPILRRPPWTLLVLFPIGLLLQLIAGRYRVTRPVLATVAANAATLLITIAWCVPLLGWYTLIVVALLLVLMLLSWRNVGVRW